MAQSRLTAECVAEKLEDGFSDYADQFWEKHPHLEDITLAPSDLRYYFDASAEWLIEGVVPSGLTILYGKPGVGKSGLALDWSLSIATGQQWLGHAVKELNVYYIHADEGSSGLPKRIAAWEQARGLTVGSTIRFNPSPIKLNDEEQLGALIYKLNKFARGSFTPGVIVIDTFAASLSGSDSDGAAVESWLNALQRLRGRTLASAIVVHHPGLKGDHMRGYSSLYGSATAVYELDGDKRLLDVAPITLSVDKAPRDADSFGEIRLRRRRVQIRLDEVEQQDLLAAQNEIRQRSGAPLLEAPTPRTSYIIERDEDVGSIGSAKAVPSVDPVVAALTVAGPGGLSRANLEAKTGLRGGSLDRRLDTLMDQRQIVRVRRGFYAIAA